MLYNFFLVLTLSLLKTTKLVYSVIIVLLSIQLNFLHIKLPFKAMKFYVNRGKKTGVTILYMQT